MAALYLMPLRWTELRDVVSALLLLAGAQPDTNVGSASSKRSALYLATARGHEAATRALVRAGEDVHFWDPEDDCVVLDRSLRDMMVLGENRQTGEGVADGRATPKTRKQ